MCISRSASLTSSSVDLKDSTRPWGNFLMKPTVSVSKNGRFSITTLRTVVSSVANSLFSAKTSDLLSKFIMVDLPTLVYPIKATLTIFSRPLLWVIFCLSIVSSCFFRSVILSRIIRRSVSISFSPGPLIPIPPLCFSR